MSKKEIPVYLFTGFLDAGKTTFIQETLEDPGFNDGQKTLLIVTEEGDTEYKPIKFASSNVKIMTLEDEEDLTESWMTNAAALCNAEKVVIEYNGMWVLDQLYNNLPENWTVYQEMTFADARNFVSYNDNMRQLVYDKIKSTESIVFKHMTRDMDQMPLHKIVRQANRRCDIIYEYGPNEIELDNIEDPLPFDMNAKINAIIVWSSWSYESIGMLNQIQRLEDHFGDRLKVLCVSIDGEKQKANAIYDMDTYADTYWRDISEAKSNVVISSPRLNNEKVNRIITELGSHQERGVKATVVTWHPDAYKYGKDYVRMELMDRLRKAGFEIKLVENDCEHYAIIDEEIVWYGSMNLLSKEDVDDNLMRVCSKEIAAELLEITFGAENKLSDW